MGFKNIEYILKILLIFVGTMIELNLGVSLRSGTFSSSSSRNDGGSGSTTTTTTITGIVDPVPNIIGSDATTCQCGVFLLGTPPLEFSSDAKPVLAGKPVTTNCTSPPDRTHCSTICRQLVQAMSNQDSPLVQTVVLAATRTLACQRFNSSSKVPLPRIHVASSWRLENTDHQKRQVLSDPKWLGGFYRWCDSHWVYAGVSVEEPLCCVNGLPSKCKETIINQQQQQQRSVHGLFTNNRSPRLIIKKRPEDDVSSEESENELETSPPLTSPTITTTTTTGISDDSSSNDGDGISSETITSFEKIDPIPVREPPGSNSQTTATKLNSTILAEAFQFVGALMRSLGMGDVAEGISTVLPTSAATELLKRIDVGGWVGKYQDRYVRYGREFNFGYCYLEYGLYNVASEGVTNIISRVFGGGGRGEGGGGGKINRRIRRDVLFDNITTNVLTNVPTTKRIKNKTYRINRNHSNSTKRQHQGGGGSSSSSGGNGGSTVPNLLNMASMMIQMAGAANGGGGESSGDKVNALLQNALPLMGQVATSPMIQGVVSNLVTSFLTPPDQNHHQGDNNNNNNIQKPPKISMMRPSDNELEAVPAYRPTNLNSNQEQNQNQNRPPQYQQQQSESGLTSMLGQIMQTYLKHVLFSTRNPPPTPPPTRQPPTKTTPPTKQSSSSSSSSSSTTSSSTSTPILEEKTDIVDTISDVAKPFFISYFGVVPDVPGFGQLNIAERTGRIRDDTLTYDPDPGSSLSDLVFGSVNLPQTGSTVYDFGNRIVFAFGRANDPTQGLYCMKQYAVNKLWDGFRVGVKTLFK